MKILRCCLLVLASVQVASALVTPTSHSAINKAGASSAIGSKSRLGAGVAVEAPRGGEGGGTASIPSEVFNLIKSIVGAGVLSLPAGK
jgi:hypothetical protein